MKTGKPQDIQDGCSQGRHPLPRWFIHMASKLVQTVLSKAVWTSPHTTYSGSKSECPQKQEVKATHSSRSGCRICTLPCSTVSQAVTEPMLKGRRHRHHFSIGDPILKPPLCINHQNKSILLFNLILPL